MGKPICRICNKPVEDGEGETHTGSAKETVENLSGDEQTISEMFFEVTFHRECMIGRKVVLPNGLFIFYAKRDDTKTSIDD